MKPCLINGKWTILLPEHRADRPNWAHWEYERNHAMYCAIRPGDIVVDVGAEEGDLSALYTSWGAKLILVEPSARMWPAIKATWEANKLQAPIASFQGFASNEGDKLEKPYAALDGFPMAADGEINIEPGFQHLNEGNAEKVTLDYLTQHYPVKILTIDTEGSEYEVILGAERLLREVKPIVFISVHPEFSYDRYRHSADDLLVLMEKWGYKPTYLGYDHEKHFMFKCG